MSKRRTESTSSSSSSDEDSNKIGGDGGAKPPLTNEKGSCKKAKNCSADSEERSPVASTSTQLQQELGIIVKDEFDESEESEVEHSDIIPSTPETEYSGCASPVAAQQSNPEVRKSNRVRVSTKIKLITEAPKRPPRSKKVFAPKPHEKYFDGYLVMGSTCIWGYPLWPGIIRKAGDEDPNYPDYFRYRRGNILFCVQFFTDPTTLVWQKTCDIRVFNPAKPNRCSHQDPSVVAEFEKGIRIVKAALNFPVEARLTKFTLENETELDDLLREIDGGADHQVAQNDSVVEDENDSAAPTGRGTGGLNSMQEPQNDSAARDEESPAPPAQGNETSITDVFAGLKKQAEFLKKKNREKEETIKALTTDNSKLTEENAKLTLRLQSKDSEKDKIESLEGKLKAKDQLIEELRVNLNRTERDKLGYMGELEKMRSEVKSLEKVFNDDMTEDGTGA